MTGDAIRQAFAEAVSDTFGIDLTPDLMEKIDAILIRLFLSDIVLRTFQSDL